jgi:hypothetical protein
VIGDTSRICSRADFLRLSRMSRSRGRCRETTASDDLCVRRRSVRRRLASRRHARPHRVTSPHAIPSHLVRKTRPESRTATDVIPRHRTRTAPDPTATRTTSTRTRAYRDTRTARLRRRTSWRRRAPRSSHCLRCSPTDLMALEAAAVGEPADSEERAAAVEAEPDPAPEQ